MENFVTTRRGKIWFLILALVVVTAVGTGTALWQWPFTKEKSIQLLENRSGRDVTIEKFERSWFPPGFTAEDVRFLRHDHPERPAMMSLKKLVVRGSWMEMLLLSRRIARVDVDEMEAFIPPRGVGRDGQTHTLISPKKGLAGAAMEIGQLIFHGATVHFLPGQAGAQPLQIHARELTLKQIKPNQPMTFDGVVENQLPRGDVHQTGTLGPWNSDDPSRTPIEGHFVFADAHMEDIPGIAGTMRTDGTFRGTLDRIEVAGSATIPNFRVLRSSHTESLVSRYEASVDASNGDVDLKRVETQFGKTTIEAEGRVSGRPNKTGRFANVEARVQNGRAEDLEAMFIKAKTAPLKGNVSLQTSIYLPPGSAPFLKRLQMEGHFETTAGTFTDRKTQTAINRLTDSAEGKNRKEQELEPTTTRSRLYAMVSLKNGLAQVSHLTLTAPATAVRMDGTFHLISQEVDMRGTLKTDGKLSDTQSGFKSFAVKLITPFLKKHGSTVAPFKVQGRYGDLKARFDWGGERKL